MNAPDPTEQALAPFAKKKASTPSQVLHRISTLESSILLHHCHNSRLECCQTRALGFVLQSHSEVALLEKYMLELEKKTWQQECEQEIRKLHAEHEQRYQKLMKELAMMHELEQSLRAVISTKRNMHDATMKQLSTGLDCCFNWHDCHTVGIFGCKKGIKFFPTFEATFAQSNKNERHKGNTHDHTNLQQQQPIFQQANSKTSSTTWAKPRRLPN